MKRITIKKVHIGIILIGIVYACLSIFHSNLWFDEAYSCGIATHSFSEIWNIGGHDVHPVLYYWVLHIIGMFTGNSIISFRIFSAISIILLGILGYTHIRKDFGEKVRNFIFIYGLLFSNYDCLCK